MAFILEIDTFKDLDTLSADIREASNLNPEMHTQRETPMTIETSKEIHEQIREQLMILGSFEGLRNESELMANIWNLEGVYVEFKIKKEI